MKLIGRTSLAAFFALLLAGTTLQGARAAEQVVTLTDAVSSGVSVHPSTDVIVFNRRATDEELRQAKGGYLPSIDMNADTGWEWTRDDPDNGGESDINRLWRYQTGLTLTQMLFDGFNTKYEVERQRARVASNSYRVTENSEFLALDIVEAYLNVLRQRELMDIAEANLNRHVEIEKQLVESNDAGRITQADVEQSHARVASARANLASVREALRTSEATYITKVGHTAPTLQRPVAPAQALAETVDEEVRQSFLNSPTLASREADIEVAAAEGDQAKSTFYPQVDFQANANHANDTGGSDGDVDRLRALVIMDWNLYRGGADTARVREGVYREAQAKATRADAARGLEESVRQTWAQMVSANERAHEFGVQADANQKVVAAYMDQFNLDRRTLLDVLDAQNEYFVSRSNVINAQYVELFAVYRLLALKGQLMPTLQVAYPGGIDPLDNYR